MTLSSRHRIWNSSPGGVRPSTLALGHGGTPQRVSHVDGEETFCFFQTAGTGNRTPNSSVKGSCANHYPYDHVNRPFGCGLAVGCQRSIPSLQIAHVLSLIAMTAMKTHHCLSRYFLTCDWSIFYPYRSNCHQLALRNVVCRHKHNGIVTN